MVCIVGEEDHPPVSFTVEIGRHAMICLAIYEASVWVVGHTTGASSTSQNNGMLKVMAVLSWSQASDTGQDAQSLAWVLTRVMFGVMVIFVAILNVLVDDRNKIHHSLRPAEKFWRCVSTTLWDGKWHGTRLLSGNWYVDFFWNAACHGLSPSGRASRDSEVRSLN